MTYFVFISFFSPLLNASAAGRRAADYHFHDFKYKPGKDKNLLTLK
jgi:hypothetical protein